MGIRIGNNNKIKNSVIAEKSIITENKFEVKERQSFLQKHPVITGVIVSILAGLILMFSFWQDFIKFIEKLFGG